MFILLFLTIFAYASYQKYHYPTTKEKILKINNQEKEYLTNFFKYSFYNANLGHVVFYDRPMNFLEVEYDKLEMPDGIDYMEPIHTLAQYRLEECWNTWNKYSNLFKLKNFSIMTMSKEGDTFYLIIFINHLNFKNMVIKHINDFHNVLENNLTPQEILDEFVKGSGVVFNKIMDHDGLLGTLLGFGRNNAWEFLRQGDGKKMDGVGNYLPEGSKELWGMQFKAIAGTEETESLRKTYEEQRQKLNKIYHSEDFLEQVLNKICG